MPRFPLSSVAAVALGLAILVGVPLLDYDYFWHLKVGEWIVTHDWRLPRTEPFSFTAAGSAWRVQGWLFVALQYLAQTHLGDTGVRAMFALLIVSTWALAYGCARLALREESRALLVTSLCLCASAPFVTPRPLAATNLCFAFVLFALLRHRASGRIRWLIALVPVFALWVNLHFGYVTGLALIVLFALADAPQARSAAASRPTTTDGLPAPLPADPRTSAPCLLTPLRAGLLLLAILLVLGVNPHGWAVLQETFRMTGTNMRTSVVEWASPDFRTVNAQLFLLPLGALFVARSRSIQPPQWIDIVLPMALIGAALFSQRHIPLACLALVPMLARAFAGWPAPTGVRLAGWRKRAGRDLGAAQYPINLALIVALIAGAVLIAPRAASWQETRRQTLLPASAADYVRTHGLTGPMLNDYHTGGYLIHRLHPAIPVFLDGRYNPFEGRVMEDYTTLMAVKSGWQAVLERYDIRLAILAAPDDGLPGAMQASGRFRLVHAADGFGVLVRNDDVRPALAAVAR